MDLNQKKSYIKGILRRIRKILKPATSQEYKKKPKTENSYIKTASADLGKSYDETFTLVKSIKEKYNLSYSDITVNKLYNFEGDELNEQALKIIKKKQDKYDYAIRQIMQSTGWTKEYTISETNRIKEKFDLSARTYWLFQLYTKTDEEILEYKENSKTTYNAKIKEISEITGWPTSKVKEHIAYCNTNFGIHTVEYYKNFRCWELTDEQLRTYAIDADSRKLAKIYNTSTKFTSNKVLFNKIFSEHLGRKYWINKDTSFEEFKAFTANLDKIFCKPINLSMGIGTKIIETNVDEDELKNIYDSLMEDNELLAEEFIVQHPKMSEIYSGSVNTVRLTAVKDADGCHNLWSFVRFGSTGIVDNFHGGGMASAVDINTGILISDAMNSEGIFFKNHPVSGIQFKGFQLPHWDKVLEISEKALMSQDDINYVGWDIAICADKVVIVEGNSTPQVGIYQSILAPTKIGQKPLYEKYLNKK